MNWFKTSKAPAPEQSAASGENASSQSAENTPSKRMRTEGEDSAGGQESEASRLVNLLGQLCKAANQNPVGAARAEAIKKLIGELIGGEGPATTTTAHIEELMRAAFLTCKADYWGAYHSSAIELPKLVEDSLLVRSWLVRGLPAPQPLKSAQMASIIAGVLSELEEEGGSSALDFRSLADTSSQVVQAVGEADALRPTSPSGCPLLQQVLITVNGGTEYGAAYSNGIAHSLGMTGEEASRHTVALALASATRPHACQLLHTLRAFEDAQAAANAGIPYEANEASVSSE